MTIFQNQRDVTTYEGRCFGGGYSTRGFESPSLRQFYLATNKLRGFFLPHQGTLGFTWKRLFLDFKHHFKHPNVSIWDANAPIH